MSEVVAQTAKIIQINAWFGRLKPALLDFIEEQQPDILCTQEDLIAPLGASALSAAHDVHERLSEKFPHQFFARTITFDLEGETVTQGNAIYSGIPMENNRFLFTSGTYTDAKQQGDDFDYNVRNLQLTELDMGNGKVFTIANHHGHHEKNSNGSKRSIESMKKVASTLLDVTGPLIVCGDFNVNPTSPAMRPLDQVALRNLTVEHALDSTLSTASSVPVPVVCDYILVNNEVQVKSFSMTEELISDHKALVMEFSV